MSNIAYGTWRGRRLTLKDLGWLDPFQTCWSIPLTEVAERIDNHRKAELVMIVLARYQSPELTRCRS